MARKKIGNLYHNRNSVIPLEWPVTLWGRCILAVEQGLGRARQWREVEFMAWLYFDLQRGVIPGPTRLNQLMGWKVGGNRNQLSGQYSKIRRTVFQHAGLVDPDFGIGARWQWPEEFESSFR